jgi:hypothetical protein
MAGETQSLKTNWSIRRLLCESCKDWTDRHVIDRHFRSEARLLKIVCGEADNGVRTKDAPGGFGWYIVLTKMNSVGIQRQRYIYAVIYYDL